MSDTHGRVESVKAEILAALARLGVGEEVIFDGRGGWKIGLTRVNVGNEIDLSHRNPDPQGRGLRYFEYTTRGNPYGAGMLNQEPTLGITLRDCGVDRDGRLVGAVVLDGDGNPKLDEMGKAIRFSWSNGVWAEGKDVKVTGQGELIVDGASYGFLYVGFLADKQRMGDGYAGFFIPSRSASVQLFEMQDAAVALVKQRLAIAA